MLIIDIVICGTFVGLAYQGKDIVFRFIIEYEVVNPFCEQNDQEKGLTGPWELFS